MKTIIFAVFCCLLVTAVLSATPTTTAAPETTPTTTGTPTTPSTHKTNPTTTPNVTPTTTPNTTPTTTPNTTPTTTPNTTPTTSKSTVPPTTTAPTTTAPTTTTPATTTPRPPQDMFELKVNKTVCLKAKMSAKFTVTYEMKDKTTNTVDVAIPKSAEVITTESACASKYNDPFLTVQFDKGDKAQFNFTQMDGKVYLSSVAFTFIEDQTRFPNATDSKTKQHVENYNFNLTMSSNTTFFECNSPIARKVTDNVTLTFDELKVQVYSVDGNFSGNGDICDADKNTTPMPTSPSVSTITPPTPTPKPTLPSTPKKGSWNITGDDGRVCMMAMMAARFEIPYMLNTTNKKETAKFDIPTKANSTGSACARASVNGSDSDTFQLIFYENFVFEMIFAKDSSKAMLSADNEYSVQNISLTYYLTEDHFPDARDNRTVARKVVSNDAQFQTPVGKAYKCDAEVSIPMSDGAILHTWDLKIEAFRTSNTTNFDEFKDCPGDTKTSNIVPIAVGAALAALVVIVLIAYVIGRRRSRSGYESV